MKKTAISGITGSIMLCIMVVFFMHPSELVKVIVSTIAITVFLVEGIILFVYSLWADD